MMSRSIPRDRRPALQQGYEQLCVWLNYDESTKHHVRHLLNSEYIRPFFREYWRDYLEAEDVVEDIGCDELFGWLRETNAFRQPKYYGGGGGSSSSGKGTGGINKKGWTALDHAARFVVRVLRFSWDNDGEWSHGRFDPDADADGESDLEFYQVWAVLRYLQAEWEAANLEAWDNSSLNATFASLMVSRL
ncbi:hypothetical protein DL767_008248 [Monosporascus sp. MG133]|nr:hypothetical protein DL767_008248 [Monosporascus sp. MG133]